MTNTPAGPRARLRPGAADADVDAGADAGPLRRAYFDAMYATRDPYGTRDRWYEERKRNILLNALPHPFCGEVFEPACGTGELTRALAARSSRVLASDFCAAAVAQARTRLGAATNVTFANHRIPVQWPGRDRAFDLIVIGEVCSFLHRAEIEAVARSCAGSLRRHGVLVVCDWRWPFDARVTAADDAHRIFDGLAPHRLVAHAEDDFLLGVWCDAARPDGPLTGDRP